MGKCTWYAKLVWIFTALKCIFSKTTTESLSPWRGKWLLCKSNYSMMVRNERGQQGLHPNPSIYSTVLGVLLTHTLWGILKIQSQTWFLPLRSSRSVAEDKQPIGTFSVVWQQFRLRKGQRIMETRRDSSPWFGPVTVHDKWSGESRRKLVEKHCRAQLLWELWVWLQMGVWALRPWYAMIPSQLIRISDHDTDGGNPE